MHILFKIIKNDLIFSLSKISFDKDKICDACQLGKQTRISFKAKNIISTSKPLEFLYKDLFGPTKIISLRDKRYDFVIIDDFLHFTWDLFLASKDEAFQYFLSFAEKFQIKKVDQLFQFIEIMALNLKIRILKNFVMKKA